MRLTKQYHPWHIFSTDSSEWSVAFRVRVMVQINEKMISRTSFSLKIVWKKIKKWSILTFFWAMTVIFLFVPLRGLSWDVLQRKIWGGSPFKLTWQVDLTYCHLSSDLRRGRRRVWPLHLTSATWQFDLSSSTVLKRKCKTLTIWASHMFLSRYLGRFQKRDRVAEIAFYIRFDPSGFLSWVYNTFSFFLFCTCTFQSLDSVEDGHPGNHTRTATKKP